MPPVSSWNLSRFSPHSHASRNIWRVGAMLALFTLTTLAPATESASAPKPSRPKRTYHVTKLTGAAPSIDGQLNDPCWGTEGEWSGGFRQFTPSYQAQPSHQTEIKVLYDDHNLYVAMRAYDDPPALRSRQAGERDEIIGDVMGINFDSYHDQRTGFEFDLTASGQKIDLILLNNSWDTTWNAVWEGKVAHERDCWTAEFLIPLSQLRFDPRNTTWGLHAWRWIDRLKEESDWIPLANDDSGLVRSFGEMVGLTDLRSQRRLELLPYGSMQVEIAPGAGARSTYRAGLDAKVGLTSNITLDASLWPDFGQVEADPAQMNLTAFETFLTEQRPLFLEGKVIFDFPFKDDTLFYSRRIGQPSGYTPMGAIGRMPETTTLLGALKLTGKTNQGFSFGVLSSLTGRERVEVEDAQGRHAVSVAPLAEQMVARGQQDFRGGDTVVGGIVTQVRRDLSEDGLRTWLPRRATVAGVDVQHFWAEREYFLRCVTVGSEVAGDPRAIARLQLSPARYYQRPIDGASAYDPGRDSLAGEGWWLKAGKASKGHWRWSEELLRKSPGLELNDLGFVSQADRVEQGTSIAYSEKTPVTWYRSYQVELNHANTWTTHHEYLGGGLTLSASAELKNKWTAVATLSARGEGRDPVALRGGPLLRVPPQASWYGELGTDNSRRVWAKVYAKGQQAGHEAFDYAGYGGQVEVRILPTLLLAAGVDSMHETDGQRYVALEPLHGAVPGYFVSRITGESSSLSVRTEWSIRPELSLRYYGNPFGSTVRYGCVRRVLQPYASDYAARYGPELVRAGAGGQYALDENGDGVMDFALGDPDYNAASFHSNLVLRWEYRRGSMLYLIWAQQRDGASPDKSLGAWSALGGLREAAANNQFMLKMTYWFSS